MCSVIAPRVNEWYLYESCVVWLLHEWMNDMCSVIRVNECLYESCVVWLLHEWMWMNVYLHEWMNDIYMSMCSVIAPVNEWYLYESCVVWLLHEWMISIWVMLHEWMNDQSIWLSTSEWMISIWVMCSEWMNAPRVNEWYLYESCVVWLLHEWMNDIYMSHV